MNKPYRRTPKNYDGTKTTMHRLGEILPQVLSEVGKVYNQRPEMLLEAWPAIIGPKLAAMATAVSFIDGVLIVKVKNSTLHSLLSQNEKPRLVNILRQKFPNMHIKTISFRIG